MNLELAKMFIDQLVMIREKTRGNLNADEQGVLHNAIANLQLAFVEAQGPGNPCSAPISEQSPEDAELPKKRFTNSYGP